MRHCTHKIILRYNFFVSGKCRTRNFNLWGKIMQRWCANLHLTWWWRFLLTVSLFAQQFLFSLSRLSPSVVVSLKHYFCVILFSKTFSILSYFIFNVFFRTLFAFCFSLFCFIFFCFLFFFSMRKSVSQKEWKSRFAF